MKVKRILFPFFKERHKFLINKWWFRMLVVAYLMALVVLPVVSIISIVDGSSSWCYDSLSMYLDDMNVFEEQFYICRQLAIEALTYVVPFIIFSAIVVHYLIQFIFYKVVVDFIALGGAPSQEVGNKSQ